MALEPVESNYEILRKNIESHALLRGRVRLYPYAAGDKTEMREFYESAIPNLGSFFRSEQLKPARKVLVQVRRLDEVVFGIKEYRPSVLRMDVEGAELLVLAGAKTLLMRYRPLLYIEFHAFLIGVLMLEAFLLECEDFGYKQGVLINRIWDVPWISSWWRRRQRVSGSLSDLRRYVTRNGNCYRVVSMFLY